MVTRVQRGRLVLLVLPALMAFKELLAYLEAVVLQDLLERQASRERLVFLDWLEVPVAQVRADFQELQALQVQKDLQETRAPQGFKDRKEIQDFPDNRVQPVHQDLPVPQVQPVVLEHPEVQVKQDNLVQPEQPDLPGHRGVLVSQAFLVNLEEREQLDFLDKLVLPAHRVFRA